MKTIGLLGGMSWESTAEYYRLANELVRDQLGGLHSAKILMHSVDFAEIEAMQVEGRWDDAGALLAEAAERLQGAGADLIVLCTNTMHKVAAPIEAAISVPFVHLGDTTADAVKAAGLSQGRAARHDLHDGAGLLRRPAPLGTGSTSCCRDPRTASASARSSTTSCASVSYARSRGRSTST